MGAMQFLVAHYNRCDDRVVKFARLGAVAPRGAAITLPVTSMGNADTYSTQPGAILEAGFVYFYGERSRNGG